MYKSREDVGSWIYVAFCKHTNKSCTWSSDKSKEISQRIKMKRSTKICNMLGTWPLRKKCLYSELFWSAGSRIQLECGKMRLRITSNTDTFYAVDSAEKISKLSNWRHSTREPFSVSLIRSKRFSHTQGRNIKYLYFIFIYI